MSIFDFYGKEIFDEQDTLKRIKDLEEKFKNIDLDDGESSGALLCNDTKTK